MPIKLNTPKLWLGLWYDGKDIQGRLLSPKDAIKLDIIQNSNLSQIPLVKRIKHKFKVPWDEATLMVSKMRSEIGYGPLTHCGRAERKLKK